VENFFDVVNIFLKKLLLISSFGFFYRKERKKVRKKLGGMGKNA